MLKFLAQRDFFKVFFTLISTPALIFFWVGVWLNDVATAKNGVIEPDVMMYAFGSISILMCTGVLLMVIDNIFDLGFCEGRDRIQRYFRDRLRDKESQERIAYLEARDRAYQEKLQQEKEEMELKQFISHCMTKGKAQ